MIICRVPASRCRPFWRLVPQFECIFGLRSNFWGPSKGKSGKIGVSPLKCIPDGWESCLAWAGLEPRIDSWCTREPASPPIAQHAKKRSKDIVQSRLHEWAIFPVLIWKILHPWKAKTHHKRDLGDAQCAYLIAFISPCIIILIIFSSFPLIYHIVVLSYNF